jgi:hypothetical protein
LPSQNEFSARIKNSNLYDDFRRENNKFGQGIDVVFGIKNGKTEIQSIRFDKTKFNKDEINKWLEKHDYKPLIIESSYTRL